MRNRTMKVRKRLEKSAGTICGHALAELERAKWRFWNGQTVRGLLGLLILDKAGASEYVLLNARRSGHSLARL